jgi:hypothetical protein
MVDSHFCVPRAQGCTEEGKLHLFVAVDQTSKFVFATLHEVVNIKVAAGF